MNEARRSNLLGRNTVIRKQDERTASSRQQLMKREKKIAKLSLNFTVRSHHRCSRLRQRPGDESGPNWLVCEAAEAGCVPAVSSRRLTSFSFIILVTTPPRPEHRASSSAASSQEKECPRKKDAGVIGTTSQSGWMKRVTLFVCFRLPSFDTSTTVG